MRAFRVPEYVSWYPLKNAVVVLDVRTQRRHLLNGAGAVLWSALGRHPTDDALAHLLVCWFGIRKDTAARDIARWADDLLRRRLLYSVGSEDPAHDHSRSESG